MAMQKTPSLGFAISMQKAGGSTSPMDTSPYAQVATPSRSNRSYGGTAAQLHVPTSPNGPMGMVATPSSRAHSALVAGTPIASPHHQVSFGPSDDSAAVSVIAPGGGTGINGAVYAQLGKDPAYAVDIVGRSRAPYDCYPEFWPHGGPPPNLATFAEDVMRQGWVEKSDCFVFGSRGGQVVLPILWDRMREKMPPVVCINGGCAMGLPRPIHWPGAAVSFLLMGGKDYFRGQATIEQYLEDAKSRVPEGNGTTAILFVNEMDHMPQAGLLSAVLPLMLKAILRWNGNKERPPREVFRAILEKVNSAGWSGRRSAMWIICDGGGCDDRAHEWFEYTKKQGEWAPSVDFSPFHVTQHVDTEEDTCARTGSKDAADAEPIEFSRKDELKELLKAAVRAAKPGGGVPLANPADRFVAAAQAAQAARKSEPPPAVHQPTSPQKKLQLQLPPGSIGQARGAGGLSPSGGSGLALPIAQAGASAGASFCHSPYGSPSNRVQGLTRAQLVAPTPISRALGMQYSFGGVAHFTSPCPSQSGSSHPPSPFSEATSPIRPPMVVVNK